MTTDVKKVAERAPHQEDYMNREAILVREWGAEAFHERVLKLEADGYISRLETYAITSEMNPDTGEIINLHQIEMLQQHSAAQR